MPPIPRRPVARRPRLGPVTALAAVLAAGLALHGAAQAQVLRCTDPATGKVTYTDGRCGSGAATREVEPRKTDEEIRQEREQAAQALERRQERLQAEAEQQRRDEAREARERRAQPRRDAADPSQSAACRSARRQLQEVTATLGRGMVDEATRLDAAQRQADQACLGPAQYLEAERARAQRPAYATPYPTAPGYAPPYYGPPVVVVPPRPVPARPAEITQCNVFRCYDRQGNIYPR